MLAERDEAIRRYLEGELAPEERWAFETQLAGDPALREEVTALQRLLAEAGSLPLHQAPEDLVARVRARLATAAPRQASRPPQRKPFLLWVPAAAAAGLLLLLTVSRWQTGPPAQAPGAPLAGATVPVTFTLRAPGAHEVAVVGDFNQWQVGTVPLAEREGDGTWTATVPIPRGRHQYQFVIDGRTWVPDPEAPIQVDDGFGNKNTVLEV
ncbi:MAG: glycoside hydrolase family 13 [Acidobacteria bacterium]|nr:glycoside hydrolase family 13 [Acidobacteriota bacterium]